MKKKKVLKVILIVIAVILVLNIGYFIRNYIIISKIAKKSR